MGAVCPFLFFFLRSSKVDATNPNGFCTICGPGNFSSAVASGECGRCPPGAWAARPGATFCYTCEQAAWCKGGRKCAAGNKGTQCARCKKGYYRMFKTCTVCPKNPFVYTIAVIAGLFVLVQIYMGFTQGTKFAYEVRA